MDKTPTTATNKLPASIGSLLRNMEIRPDTKQIKPKANKNKTTPIRFIDFRCIIAVYLRRYFRLTYFSYTASTNHTPISLPSFLDDPKPEVKRITGEHGALSSFEIIVLVILVQEMVFAVWLIAKGFNKSATVS